jgi:uncharacterized paraquat-inducible protein A
MALLGMSIMGFIFSLPVIIWIYLRSVFDYNNKRKILFMFIISGLVGYFFMAIVTLVFNPLNLSEKLAAQSWGMSAVSILIWISLGKAVFKNIDRHKANENYKIGDEVICYTCQKPVDYEGNQTCPNCNLSLFNRNTNSTQKKIEIKMRKLE